MIFVTIGMMYGFERLIKWMDEIAGELDEKIIMQIGPTLYKPQNTEYFIYESMEKIEQHYADARVIVCHAGVGSIIVALNHKKEIILVPRLREQNEVIDDHQIEIAQKLKEDGYLDFALTKKELTEKITNSNFSKQSYQQNRELVQSLKDYINTLNN